VTLFRNPFYRSGVVLLGFTRKEQAVLIFLVVSLILGSALRIFQEHWIPLPEADESLLLDNEGDTAADSLYEQWEGIKEQQAVRVFINRAEAKELERLPGIGPVMAQRIVDFRSQNGRFGRMEDLMKVKGIGKKTLEKLKPFIEL